MAERWHTNNKITTFTTTLICELHCVFHTDQINDIVSSTCLAMYSTWTRYMIFHLTCAWLCIPNGHIYEICIASFTYLAMYATRTRYMILYLPHDCLCMLHGPDIWYCIFHMIAYVFHMDQIYDIVSYMCSTMYSTWIRYMTYALAMYCTSIRYMILYLPHVWLCIPHGSDIWHIHCIFHMLGDSDG